VNDPLDGASDAAGVLNVDVRLPKTSEIIATRLRQQIITGRLAEGDALPTEASLIKLFGVSRPALREALRLLESDGLIVIRRGNQGGARVQAPNSEVAARYTSYFLQYQRVGLADVYHAVSDLEAPCAREVALSHTDEGIRRLEEAVAEAEAERHGSPESALAKQRQFHALLVELAGNQTTRMLWAMLQRIVSASQIANVANDPSQWSDSSIDEAYKTHRRLIDHIRNGDGDKAESLWRRHLQGDVDYVLRGMETATVVDLLKGSW
jgi:DNA-binding FadR family transcriptional regulator